MSTTSRRRPLAAMLMLGTIAMVAAAPTVLAGNNVTVSNFAYTPAKFSVVQGATVTWTNTASVTAHSVTSDAPLSFWKTTDLSASGGTFDKTFKAAGTFPYHCRFHSSMHGKIKVPVAVDHVGVDFTINAMMGTTDWPAASPYRNVIQVRPAGSSTWMTISQGRSGQAMFHATQGPGEYSFRSAVRRATNGAMSLWSKVVKVVIG